MTALVNEAEWPRLATRTCSAVVPPVGAATAQEARVRAERLELALELHDVVGSAFAMITLQAAAAERLLDKRPDQALRALSEIKRASGEVLRELREILGGLRSASDQAPGTARIGWLVDATTEAGVHTRLMVSGRRRLLPADVDLAAYRIVQESLTNVLRHSSTARASVLVAYERDRLRVEVKDDGLARGESLGGGFGILGMRERAVALGGELDAGPRPLGGFRVRATLPLRTLH
jgi:signal transduction histidine kinase